MRRPRVSFAASRRALSARARPGWLPDAAQSLTALGVNSTTSLVAGLTLGALTGTFEDRPGLLVLVPAAIGLRGNVFSALGSRLSTSVHAGTFSLSRRRGTVLVENVVGALLLTSGVSLALAAGAWLLAQWVLSTPPIPLISLATISVAGGLLASVVVLAVTIGIAVAAASRGWDLDNLVAPVVSTLGDVLTLPALWLAIRLVDHGALSDVLGWALVVLAVAGSLYSVLSREELLRDICRQSWPVLVAAGGLSLLAGLVIEHRLEALAAVPAVLVLLPAFVSSAGALGGVLSARVATGLHLGTRHAGLVPDRATRDDVALLGGVAVPVMLFNAVGAQVVATWAGQAGPGLGTMVAGALLAGVGAVAFALVVADLSAISAVRLRLDPDTYGIPLVTSSVDLVGAALLTAVFAALGAV
jgi:mgtE-like transporter